MFQAEKVEARASESMIGQRFGRLVVVESAGVNHLQKRAWRCKCDCGNETIVITGQLRNGKTKSCGCLKAERCAEGNPKHGDEGQNQQHASPMDPAQRPVFGLSLDHARLPADSSTGTNPAIPHITKLNILCPRPQSASLAKWAGFLAR